MARPEFNGGTFTNHMTGAPVRSEQRQAAVLRSRALHEQRRAAGKCDRCAKKTSGRYWYCLKCRVEISQSRATARAARKHQQIDCSAVPAPQSPESPSVELS